MKRRARRVAIAAAVLAVGLGLRGPVDVRASCAELDLASIPRTEATAVFVGTVLGEQAGHVFMRVDAWFLGPLPVESADVVGGKGSNDPGVVTSVDWTPQVGESYLIVAERAAGQGFATKPCQQVAVDAALLQRASSVFGEPLRPPFAQPGSSATPSASAAPGTPTGDPAGTGASADGEPPGLQPLAIVAVLIGLVATGVLGRALIRARRRPEDGGSTS